MKRVVLLFMVMMMAGSLSGCNNEPNSYEDEMESQTVALETENSLNDISEPVPTPDTIVFEEIKYLNRDNLFLLTDEDEQKYVVDCDGNMEDLENVSLKSGYLSEKYQVVEGGSVYGVESVHDIWGNDKTDLFIKDEYHENIVGIYHSPEQDYVWVKERVETPSASMGILKAYNEDGTEIYRIDSNQCEAVADEYDRIENCGDNMCFLYKNYDNYGGILINTKTWQIVLDTGYWGYFSDGYATLRNNGDAEYMTGDEVIDTNGKCVAEGTLRETGNGLVFDKNKKCFLDFNKNVIADFNGYKGIVIWSDDTDNAFVFKDGYSIVAIENDGGTIFYGIIDTSGKYVMELTDTIESISYEGMVADRYLLLHINYSETYETILLDSETKELKTVPDPVDFEHGYEIDGKFINDFGEFCFYDFEESTVNPISIS